MKKTMGWVLISKQGNVHPPLHKSRAYNMVIDPEDRIVEVAEYNPLEAAVLREALKANKARKRPGAFTVTGDWDAKPLWEALEALEEQNAAKPEK